MIGRCGSLGIWSCRIHRNTFVNAPRVLRDRLELVARPGVFLAGQITGVEGYAESAACGWGRSPGRALPRAWNCLRRRK